MDVDLERVLVEAEDFLLRNLRSGFSGVFHGKKARRKIGELLRRLRRAGLLLAGMLALVAVASVVSEFGLLTWIVALATAILFSFLSLFWPTRAPALRIEQARTGRLDETAARAADLLHERHDEFPGPSVVAVDAIIVRLRELAPHLSKLDPNSTTTGDARRLICEHLPRLLDAYFELPSRARGSRSENSLRLAESLRIIANELDHLLDQHRNSRHMNFETEHRFIESRYGEDGRLKGT